jgi:hypothetical protein
VTFFEPPTLMDDHGRELGDDLREDELYSPSGRREDIEEEIFDPLAKRYGHDYGYDIQE